MTLTLHVGPQKSGTTYLQQVVFPRLEHTEFLKHGKTVDLTAMRYYDDILISNENFSGAMVKGNQQQEFRRSLAGLKRLFPNAQIMFGIRDPKDRLWSMYMHHAVYKAPKMTFEEFFGKTNSCLSVNDALIMPRIRMLMDEFEETFFYDTKSLSSEAFENGLEKFLDDALLSKSAFNRQPIRTRAHSSVLLRARKLCFLQRWIHPHRWAKVVEVLKINSVSKNGDFEEWKSKLNIPRRLVEDYLEARMYLSY